MCRTLPLMWVSGKLRLHFSVASIHFLSWVLLGQPFSTFTVMRLNKQTSGSMLTMTRQVSVSDEFDCYRPDGFVHLCVSSAVGRMWHPGCGSVALSDPGKLCHPVIIPSLPVCSQPPHRGGDHHHGDWLSGVCRSCQREPSSAVDGKYFFSRKVFNAVTDFDTRLCWCDDAMSLYSHYIFLGLVDFIERESIN